LSGKLREVRQQSIHKFMKAIFFVILWFSVSVAALAEPPFDERFQFLYFATIEGAHADGLTDAETDRILLRADNGKGAHLHFVYACPICMPVINALLAYRTRPPWFGYKIFGHPAEHRTMGAGLSAELRQQLASDDQGTRLKAVNTLVARWVERRLTMMNLTPEQRKKWEQRFEDGRKEGMKMLVDFRQQGNDSLKAGAPGFTTFDECAACNAATLRPFKTKK
jgi:hypothetical protein